MNISPKISLFPSRISGLVKSIAIALGVGIISACSSVGISVRTQESSLPIKVAHTTSGTIASARAFETSDRLYVSGLVQYSTGHHPPTTLHVDVELIGEDGGVLGAGRDAIDLTVYPQTTLGHIRRAHYVVSLPISKARQAARIFVRYHLGGRDH